MNEINKMPLATSEPLPQAERASLSAPAMARAPRPGGRMAPLILTGTAGVILGIGAALLGWIPLSTSGRSPEISTAARSGAIADAPPALRREAGSVTIHEGSPYRERVAVAPVEQRSLEQTRILPAAVEADPARVFNVLPPLGGRVTELKVRLGDRVTQGQPLAVIDSGDLAQVYADADKAQAQVALTRRTLARARGLNQVGGGAVKDVDSAANDAAQAEAEFSRTQARLKAIGGTAAISGTRALTVAAPAAGTITALASAQGAYINDATQSMMTLTNLDQVWVTANVPEKDIGFVSKDQGVDVAFAAYPGETFHGTVLFVNDLMEPDTRRTKVRIGFANPDSRFKPNMFATVTFRAPPRPALFVPSSALLMNNDATTVFVETSPWTFVRRAVQPGYDVGGQTVINSGLAPGERVVSRGGVLLND